MHAKSLWGYLNILRWTPWKSMKFSPSGVIIWSLTNLKNLRCAESQLRLKMISGINSIRLRRIKDPEKNRGIHLTNYFFFVAVYHQVHHKFSLKYVNLMKFQASPAPLPHNPFLQWSMWTSELSVSHGLQPSLQRVGKHRFRYKPSKQCSAVL